MLYKNDGSVVKIGSKIENKQCHKGRGITLPILYSHWSTTVAIKEEKFLKNVSGFVEPEI